MKVLLIKFSDDGKNINNLFDLRTKDIKEYKFKIENKLNVSPIGSVDWFYDSFQMLLELRSLAVNFLHDIDKSPRMRSVCLDSLN